jgi:hypothetical protein
MSQAKRAYEDHLTPYKNAETTVKKRKESKFHEDTKNEMENKKKKHQSTKKNLEYRSHLNIPHTKKSDALLDDESREEI